MPYRLVAIDLDGTLLNSKHEISPANAAAVRACADQGVRVVIASGRSFFSIQPYAVALELPGPHISQNGALMSDQQHGTLEITPALPAAALQQVCSLLEANGIEYVIYGEQAIYALPGTNCAEVLRHFGEPEAEFVPDFSPSHVRHPLKVMAFLPPGPLENELRATISPAIETLRTGPNFLEWMLPGVSKGAMLAQLAERLEIPASEILAIGDSYNDLSMFDFAGMSVAMGGSDAPIQARAQASTSNCDDDGVAHALQRFVLNPA